MRLVETLLVAITLLFAVTDTGASTIRRSRFLAAKGPKKCTIDPYVCQSSGSGGPDCCGDNCVDVNTDALNCGHCGKVCKFTDSCCEGKCVDLTFDKKNCGSCGNQCAKGVKCYYGLCNYA